LTVTKTLQSSDAYAMVIERDRKSMRSRRVAFPNLAVNSGLCTMILVLSRLVRRADCRRPKSRRRYKPVFDGCNAPLEQRVLLSNVSILQYRNDNGNTGQNQQETTLTPSNVNPTDFGKLYQYPVDGYAYAQPLYMANVTIPGQGTHNVVFVATEHDSVYAFDANGGGGPNGTPLWHDSFINPAAGITALSQSDIFGEGDIVPEVGITATPVIDGTTGTLYVVSKTKNIESGVEHVVQELHALNVATGAEMDGGPVVIADTTVNSDGSYTYNSGPAVAGSGDGNVNGVITFNALTQNERAALELNHGSVYLSYSSHADIGPYHGWVLGYNETTLAPTAVFNTTPNGGLGSIWGAGEGLAIDSQGNMYLVTGNGTFDTTLDSATGFPSSADYGNSVVKIAVDPSSSAAHPNPNGWGLKVLDYFTPSDQDTLNQNDTDFGSGGPLLLPATATGPQVVVVAGKEGTIFVLDTDTGKMGEYSSSTNNVYQEIQNQIGGVWGAPASFNGSVYFGGVNDNIKAFQLQPNNMLSSTPTSTSPEGFGYPGPTPNSSADGLSHGVLWALDNTAYGAQGPAVLYAYDATNLATEFYNSSDSGTRDQAAGAVKFTVPTIANGMVYVGGEYALTIYGLISGVTLPAAPSQLAASALSSSQVKLTWQSNSTNQTGFTIERSTDGMNFASVATAGPSALTYTDGGLTARTHYVYEVFATNAAGSSGPSNQAPVTTLASSLPAGWSDSDIGAPSRSGSASYASGVYTVYGSGNDIWNTADQFHFVYRTLTADGTIIARVASQQSTDLWAKAGVMMRQSLDAGSPYAFVMATPGNGVDFQWRPTQDAGSTWGGNVGVYAVAPYWVKLTRAGSTFTASASSDGQNWSPLGSIVIPMSTQIYVGLAVCAHNGGALNGSTFDHLSVNQSISRGYLAIQAGGGPSGTFQADKDYSGGTTASYSASINTSGVTNPAPLAVYQTERYGTFTYTIPALQPGALFTVRLHFSEDYSSGPNQRLFNVAINGTRVLGNFDVYAAAGGMDTAIVKQFAALANSKGQIVISFAATAQSPDQNAEVKGIEIIPVQFNQQLVAKPASISAASGHTFTGTVATFVDSSPGGLARDYIATTNWGDGTVTTGVVSPVTGGSGFSVAGAHVYKYGGRYHVIVVIQSYDGAGTQAGETAIVSGPPLLKSVGAKKTVQAGVGKSTGNVVLATFSDTNAGAPPKTLSSTVTWGDGSTSKGTVVATSGGYSVVASHIYNHVGTYVPVVKLTDSGATAQANTTTIVVSRPKHGHFRAGHLAQRLNRYDPPLAPRLLPRLATKRLE
jgi:regulation of enolase protein 1 (concanavalin A-like superfamily)